MILNMLKLGRALPSAKGLGDGNSAMSGPIRALHACALAAETASHQTHHDDPGPGALPPHAGRTHFNLKLNFKTVNRAVPAFGAEIFESTCRMYSVAAHP